jgi:phenylalanyl-tRNA synthetase alpha subunit
LFANSLFQTQEHANKEFEKCIVNLSAETTKTFFKKEIKDQEEALVKLSGITNEYTDLTNAVTEYNKDISDVTSDYNAQIQGVKESQQESNTLSNETKGSVSQYMVKLQTIFDNITNYFQK